MKEDTEDLMIDISKTSIVQFCFCNGHSIDSLSF